MEKTVLIDGMTCNHCVMHVKEELGKIPGVKLLTVEIGKAIIEGDASEEDIKAAVDEAGYVVTEIK